MIQSLGTPSHEVDREADRRCPWALTRTCSLVPMPSRLRPCTAFPHRWQMRPDPDLALVPMAVARRGSSTRPAGSSSSSHWKTQRTSTPLPQPLPMRGRARQLELSFGRPHTIAVQPCGCWEMRMVARR